MNTLFENTRNPITVGALILFFGGLFVAYEEGVFTYIGMACGVLGMFGILWVLTYARLHAEE